MTLKERLDWRIKEEKKTIEQIYLAIRGEKEFLENTNQEESSQLEHLRMEVRKREFALNVLQELDA